MFQASASFFDSAFQPLEFKFGKLISDVVSDERETIDCTIFAVENIFSIGGMFKDISEYERRCKGGSNDNVVTPAAQNTYYTQQTETGIADYPQIPKGMPRGNEEAKKELTEHIKESLSDTGQSILGIIEKNDAQERIENVKSVIKNEIDRLGLVSIMIRQELGKLSDETKSKFNILDIDSERVSVQQVLKAIGALYKVEQSDKSSSRANEIRHVFDKILDVFRVEVTDGAYSDEDEVKEIIQNLESSENDSRVDIEKLLSEWKKDYQIINKSQDIVQNENVSSLKKEIDKMPKTFKDIATKIFNEGGGIQRSKSNEIVNSFCTTIAANAQNMDITNSFQNTANRIMKESKTVDTDQMIKSSKKAAIIFNQIAKEQEQASESKSTQDKIFEDSNVEENTDVANGFQSIASRYLEESKPVDTDQIVKSTEESTNIFSQSTKDQEKSNGFQDSFDNIIDGSKSEASQPTVSEQALNDTDVNAPVGQNATSTVSSIPPPAVMSSISATTEIPDYNDYDTAETGTNDLLLSRLFGNDDSLSGEDQTFFEDLFSDSDSAVQTDTRREDAAKEAESIIKQSIFTSHVMDNILNNGDEENALHAFDNPELLQLR